MFQASIALVGLCSGLIRIEKRVPVSLRAMRYTLLFALMQRSHHQNDIFRLKFEFDPVVMIYPVELF